MNIAKEFTSDRPEHEIFLEDESKCCLCGTELQFQHNVDFHTLKVKEDAHCPCCKIQMKSREHGLQ